VLLHVISKKETNMDHNKAEHDYSHNKDNPGPSKEALEEKNDKPASKLLNWVLIIAVLALTIFFLFFYY
jgi:hypothetical protein